MKPRTIAIAGAIAKEMCLMLAASITLIAMAEGVSWLMFFVSKED